MRVWFIVLLFVTLPALAAVAQEGSDTAKTKANWSAKEVPSEVVDTIISRNIFVPDQRRAPRVETPAQDADDAASDQSPPPVEAQPEDPGRRFRLIGASFSTGQWIAFIEEIDTSDIHRLAVDGPIANGTVATIDYDRIEYAVDGEVRDILIGRDLTGAEPVKTAVSYPGTNGPAAPPTTATPPTNNSSPTATPTSDADARRAEILRQLRERRERENQ
ncbi:MAG: hypothetical protein R3C45_05115 [Phycisphaerales bacterium]